MVLIIVIMASCAVLVGISYVMLDILSGLVVAPKTPVRESGEAGELAMPLPEGRVLSMQVSGDGNLLAYMEKEAAAGTATLHVVEAGAEGGDLFGLEVEGDSLAWLGESNRLVYEDGGDIHLLDVGDGSVENLTAGTAFDVDPVPSPDGRYIMWTVGGEEGGGNEAELWVMEADGSDPSPLAEFQDLAVWDPAGGVVVSRHDTALSAMEDSYRYFLQTAVPGGGDWNDYAECEGEALFIWWPLQGELLYVAPKSMGNGEGFRGVWYRVEPPDGLKKVASTDGLGFDKEYYRFFPARGEEKVAYVGEKGLEVMDYGERVIYRYSLSGAEAPLAWDEVNDSLYYAGPEGIYRVALEEG